MFAKMNFVFIIVYREGEKELIADIFGSSDEEGEFEVKMKNKQTNGWTNLPRMVGWSGHFF